MKLFTILETALTKVSDLLWGVHDMQTLVGIREPSIDEARHDGVVAEFEYMQQPQPHVMSFVDWCLDGNDERVRSHFGYEVADEGKIHNLLRAQYATYKETACL